MLTRRRTMQRRRRRLIRSNMRSRRLYRIRVTTGRRKPPMTTTLPIWSSRIHCCLHKRWTTV
jgi:hypothetical protein